MSNLGPETVLLFWRLVGVDRQRLRGGESIEGVFLGAFNFGVIHFEASAEVGIVVRRQWPEFDKTLYTDPENYQ